MVKHVLAMSFLGIPLVILPGGKPSKEIQVQNYPIPGIYNMATAPAYPTLEAPITQVFDSARTDLFRIIQEILQHGPKNQLLRQIKELCQRGLLAKKSLTEALLLIAHDNKAGYNLSSLVHILIQYGADVTFGKILFYTVENKFVWLFDMLIAAAHANKTPFRLSHFQECKDKLFSDTLDNCHNCILTDYCRWHYCLGCRCVHRPEYNSYNSGRTLQEEYCYCDCYYNKWCGCLICDDRLHHYEPFYLEKVIVYQCIPAAKEPITQDFLSAKIQTLALELMPEGFVITDDFIQQVCRKLPENTIVDQVIGAILEVRTVLYASPVCA